MKLPLAQTEYQIKLWNSLQPINRPAACDTYKRTMSGSSDMFANNFSCYNLAARRPLKEKGADGRLIMAGIEKMIYPWFMNPVTKEEVDKAKEFFTKKAGVKKFPEKAWQAVLDNKGYLPIDIYSLPGGQTFLVKDGKYVPILSVEGSGALVTHLEPHLETLYTSIIHATKARLFYEAAGKQFAEFGLRSDQNINNHALLMLALKVGGGFELTSDDQAVLLFPEYFKDIGTVGHEFIMAYQRKNRTLEEAQSIAYDAFVEANNRSALLPDVVHTINSGLPAILKKVLEVQGTDKVVMPRFDSGDVASQCIKWKRMTLEAGIKETKIVVEDGYTPEKAIATKQAYSQAGFNPEDIIVGAGGYFQDNCSRDAISLAYKRSATKHKGILEASMKFSDSPGKESIPGQVRVYGRDDAIIVAQEGEYIEGIPLMVKLIDNGRINYFEDLDKQHKRALETWNQYTNIEYSPQTQAIIYARTKEKDRLLARFE